MPASRDPLLREQPWNAPPSLSRHHDINPLDDDYTPLTLEDAAVYVRAHEPAEVAAYTDEETKLSVAREIAGTIFRHGVPIGENYSRWLAHEPIREPMPEPMQLSAAQLLQKKIDETTYVVTGGPSLTD